MDLVRLKTEKEMLKALRGVKQEPHYEQYFYPILLEKAGMEMHPLGVCIMFIQSVETYVKGNHLPPIMSQLILLSWQEYLTALIEGDPSKSVAYFKEAKGN